MNQKLFFVLRKHLLEHHARRRIFKTRQCSRKSRKSKVGKLSVFSDEFFKQRGKVGKKTFPDCDRSVKSLLEILNRTGHREQRSSV